MSKEAAVLNRVRKAMTTAGAKCIKTSGEGEPDLVCCLAGRSVVIETKQPGEKPEPLQYVKLRQWALSGALAFWTDDGKTMTRVVPNEPRSELPHFPFSVVEDR